MAFRIKLRIKSVKPHYPAKPAPVSVFPSLRDMTDPDLLRRLYEAARDARVPHDGQWRSPTTPPVPLLTQRPFFDPVMGGTH